MGDAVKLAIGILTLFAAMVCFFFAFHPHGVQNPNDHSQAAGDPGEALQFLMNQFDTVTQNTGGKAAGSVSG